MQNELFSVLDDLVDRHGVHKVETIVSRGPAVPALEPACRIKRPLLSPSRGCCALHFTAQRLLVSGCSLQTTPLLAQPTVLTSSPTPLLCPLQGE